MPLVAAKIKSRMPLGERKSLCGIDEGIGRELI